MPQFVDQFPEVDKNAPSYGFHTGFMTGMLELGAFIGCLFFPYIADKISRKWAISVATGFFCVGAIIQTASQNYDTLVAGRFIGGIGVGTLAMGAPLYISEIASARFIDGTRSNQHCDRSDCRVLDYLWD
jgi:MFS family permease